MFASISPERSRADGSVFARVFAWAVPLGLVGRASHGLRCAAGFVESVSCWVCLASLSCHDVSGHDVSRHVVSV